MAKTKQSQEILNYLVARSIADLDHHGKGARPSILFERKLIEGARSVLANHPLEDSEQDDLWVDANSLADRISDMRV